MHARHWKVVTLNLAAPGLRPWPAGGLSVPGHLFCTPLFRFPERNAAVPTPWDLQPTNQPYRALMEALWSPYGALWVLEGLVWHGNPE